MLNSFRNKNKFGSVLIVVICIFVAIIALSTGLFMSSGHRRYQTKKLNEISYTREYAFAIAELAKTYLRQNLDNLGLKEILSKEREDFIKVTGKVGIEKEIDLKTLEDFYKMDIGFLSEVGDGKRNIKIKDKIKYIISNEDFNIVDNKNRTVFRNSYPREKTGLIHICFTLAYDSINEKGKSEYFDFIVRVKVTNAIIPVLSKFNLYVADALVGEGSDKFNKLRTNKFGKRINEKAHVWNLKNSDYGGLMSFDSYNNDIIKSEIGLVYLGSGVKSDDEEDPPIYLNLSGVTATDSEVIGRNEFGCGEPMLFSGQASGSYVITSYSFSSDIAEYKLRYFDLGFVKDDTDDLRDETNLKNLNMKDLVKEQVKKINYKDDTLECSSILKLYGAGKWEDCSPTLVLGNVKSRKIIVSQLGIEEMGDFDDPVPPPIHVCLPYIDIDNFQAFPGGEESEYEINKDFEVEDKGITQEFLNVVKEQEQKKENGIKLTYKFYKENIATHIHERPYNSGLFSYMSNYFCKKVKHEHTEEVIPPEACLLNDPNLYRYAYGKEKDGNNPLNKDDLHNIPGVYNSIYNSDKSNSIKLSNMLSDVKDSLVLNANSFEYTRSGYICKLGKNEKLTDKLLKHGLAKKINEKIVLDFEGWLYVETDNDLNLGKFEFARNCGIALAERDIVVNGDILRYTDDNGIKKDCVLYLVALSGNIRIGGGVDKLETALCAFETGGKITFNERQNTKSPLKINGCMAMSKLYANDMKCDLFLDYNTKFSALPNRKEGKNIEDKELESQINNLLMFTIYDNMELLF